MKSRSLRLNPPDPRCEVYGNNRVAGERDYTILQSQLQSIYVSPTNVPTPKPISRPVEKSWSRTVSSQSTLNSLTKGNRHRDHSGVPDKEILDNLKNQTVTQLYKLKMRPKSYMKTAIILFNLIVFGAGCAVLGLGIFILISDFGAKELSTLLGNELYHDTAYLAIAAGAAIAIISLCGCCGSVKESKCILILYLVLMSLIFIILLAAAVLLFIFLGKISKDTRESMTTVLIERYGVDLENRAENRMITDLWNFMQKQLECCGVSGDLNSTTSWAIYKTQSNWHKQFQADVPYVPDSCCRAGGDVGICTGLTPFQGPPKVGPPVYNSADKNPHLFTSGCYDELVHYIQGHTFMIGGVALVAIVIINYFVYFCRVDVVNDVRRLFRELTAIPTDVYKLFGIISGVCLCRRIKFRDYMT